ncbi:MAG: diguanylate cyclase [Thermoleophilales bacterium]|nr:diguanylate cyclase [Thermoleophilales bacterium]
MPVNMSFFQKRRWLVEFGVVCLVPIVLIGWFLMQTLKSNVSGRAISNAREQARLVTDVGLSTPLAGVSDLSHGLTPGQQQALDRELATIRQGNGIERAMLRNRDGKVVYADDHSLVGQSKAPAGAADAANGNIVSSIGNGPNGKVLDVFVPLALGAGPASGSAELWLPYAPIAATIDRQNGKIELMLIAGLVLLWGTLLTVVSAASQRLRRQAAEKEEQALSDGLTGLPNRTMFTGLVQSTLSGAGRRKRAGAVMLMDLDRFKDVNDTLGHHNGDLLLQRIASRLDSVLRNTATVARLGGDEFAILLTDVNDRQAVVPVVRRILKVLEEPVVVGGLALQVEASIGIAMFPEHGRTVDAVMRAADVAMYVTKEQRSGYEFYDEERHEHRHDAGRLALIGELRRAMDETELVLFYQPKVALDTGQVKGVEALARWHHPERGLLSPDEFIPLAERSNLLRPMTLYLIDTALRQANAWRAKGLEISVAVNLSMQNMLDLRLPNDLARLLTSWRLPAGSLELEITESTIMADHRRATTILSRLSKMGVRLSIDDFGTGYSSLAYLQELPVDAIKIDKSFVMEMHTDPGNATIVQSTVDLGHNLGLEVVAEGVETVESYNTLANLGCDYAQGYFLSKPLSPEKMSIWLEVFCGIQPDDTPAPLKPRDRRELDQWSITAPVQPEEQPLGEPAAAETDAAEPASS